MQSATLKLSKIHLLRIDPGEDVLQCVKAFLHGQGLRQAVVLGGYGTLATYHLHWVLNNQLPAVNTYANGEGGIEILAMNGLVVEGEPHIHITLSTQAGAYGGHLEEGCRVYVLCEIFFAELEGPPLSKQMVEVAVESMGSGRVPRLTFGA